MTTSTWIDSIRGLAFHGYKFKGASITANGVLFKKTTQIPIECIVNSCHLAKDHNIFKNHNLCVDFASSGKYDEKSYLFNFSPDPYEIDRNGSVVSNTIFLLIKIESLKKQTQKEIECFDQSVCMAHNLGDSARKSYQLACKNAVNSPTGYDEKQDRLNVLSFNLYRTLLDNIENKGKPALRLKKTNGLFQALFGLVKNNKFVPKLELDIRANKIPKQGSCISIEKLMVNIIFHTGLRYKELSNIRTDDINLSNCKIKIFKEKTKKVSLVFFPWSLRKAMAVHIEKAKKRGSSYLFNLKGMTFF